MTDEESADDYEMDCIADVYKDEVCTIPYAYSAQKIVQAYKDGLAEGRKETTEKILTLEKENKKLDESLIGSTKQNIERQEIIDSLKKENEELKEQIERISVTNFNVIEKLKAQKEQMKNL